MISEKSGRRDSNQIVGSVSFYSRNYGFIALDDSRIIESSGLEAATSNIKLQMVAEYRKLIINEHSIFGTHDHRWCPK